MRATNQVLFLTILGMTAAQLENLPSCATSCVTDIATSDGCADVMDFQCHCSQPELPETILACLDDACSEDAVTDAARALQDICSGVGVEIDLPTGDTSPSDETPSSTAGTHSPTSTSPRPSEEPTPTDNGATAMGLGLATYGLVAAAIALSL